MTIEYLDLKMDFMFKQLFGQPSRKNITIAFLNDLLGRTGAERITDLSYENTELVKDRMDGKAGWLDLAVTTSLGERINVEIQIMSQHDMPERILFYWAKTYSSTISSGENYRELTPTLFISLLNYAMFPLKMNKFHTVFHIREDSEKFLWSEHLEFHVFDLSTFVVQCRKYRREMKKNASKQLPWLLMLSAADFQKRLLDRELFSDLEEWAMNVDQVREALIEWETLSANKENRVLFDARAKELRDLLSNLEGERRLGIEEGMEKGRVQIALKMLQRGLDHSLVMEMTGLSEEKIKHFCEEYGIETDV